MMRARFPVAMAMMAAIGLAGCGADEPSVAEVAAAQAEKLRYEDEIAAYENARPSWKPATL